MMRLFATEEKALGKSAEKKVDEVKLRRGGKEPGPELFKTGSQEIGGDIEDNVPAPAQRIKGIGYTDEDHGTITISSTFRGYCRRMLERDNREN